MSSDKTLVESLLDQDKNADYSSLIEQVASLLKLDNSIVNTLRKIYKIG